MRSNLLGMGLCSTVAAVAVAGSANAALVNFNGVTLPNPNDWEYVTNYGGFGWDQLWVINQNYWQTNPYYGGDTSGFTGNIAFNNNGNALYGTWAGAGSISLDSLNIGKIWPGITGNAATSVWVKGFKNSVEVASQLITLTGSTQLVSITAPGFGDIDKFGLWSGSGGGYFYFDSFSYTAVPAPGAAALVGVAGLVTSRRRRA